MLTAGLIASAGSCLKALIHLRSILKAEILKWNRRIWRWVLFFLTAINKLSCAEWIKQFCFALNPSEPLKLNPPPPSYSCPSWPIQTQTVSPARTIPAYQTVRSSWSGYSRRSLHAASPCLCGRRSLCRPGWRLSWQCPCTSVPVQRMSRVER